MCRPEISTKRVTRKSGNTRTRSSRLTSGVASFGGLFERHVNMFEKEAVKVSVRSAVTKAQNGWSYLSQLR